MSARAAGGMRSGIHQSSLAASFGGSARAEVAERVAAAGERTAHEQNLVANPGLRLAQIWRRVTTGPAAPAEQIARDVAEHSLLGAQVGDTIPAAEGGGGRGPAAAAGNTAADADADASDDEDEAEEEEESAEPPPLKIVPETHAVARWSHDTCVRLAPRLVRSTSCDSPRVLI